MKQPQAFQQEIARLIKERSIAAAKAKIKREIKPQKIKKVRKIRKVRKDAIVLNMMGSIVAKIVRVKCSTGWAVGLSIATQYGPIAIKSQRSDVEYLTLFIEDGAIVSHSLSISIHGVKASIGVKRYSYENAVPYVYELVISK